jgi:ABC-type transport system substrate-binding protein
MASGRVTEPERENTVNRRQFVSTTSALAAIAALPMTARAQESAILRVGLSNSVIPRTTGLADRGIEGRRFIGHTIYDPLLYYGSQGNGSPYALQPYLATEWSSDPQDRLRWTFRLRDGVRFHDGSDFTAEAVAWNFAKLYDEAAPQFKADEAASAQAFGPRLVSWTVDDRLTITVTTETADPFVPYSMSNLTFVSPAQFDAVGGSWDAFAAAPSGTGPFRLTFLAPQERAELTRNDSYWDPNRIPHVARMDLFPIAEPNTRTAALLSGQVDWIEAVTPDAVDVLRGAGAQVVTNPYPQVWSYWFSFLDGSPWRDPRVRRAANLAVDREGLVGVLNGLMVPAVGHYPPDHPWFGTPSFTPAHDPDEARRLLAEAGFGPKTPLRSRLLATDGGSGMMQPPPMNAFVQDNLRAVGIEMEIVIVDWNALFGALTPGAADPASMGCDMINLSVATMDPSEMLRLFGSRFTAPNGINWGGAVSARADAALEAVYQAFDPAEQNRLLGAFHAAIVDDDLALFIAHDPFPRAFAANVSGFAEGYNGIRVQDPSFIRLG